MNILDKIVGALLTVGGLNWGLVGIFNFDLVDYLFVELAGVEMLATIVYIVVGLAAAYSVKWIVSGCEK